MTAETPDRKINTDDKLRDNSVKKLPHERDESPEGRVKPPRGVMQQAADDLQQGLVDTDLHGERGVEEAVRPTGAGQARPHASAGDGMRHRADQPAPKGQP